MSFMKLIKDAFLTLLNRIGGIFFYFNILKTIVLPIPVILQINAAASPLLLRSSMTSFLS
ncbi:hypothetical protein HMPREF0578_0398 [Mobiluncus mulieris 28-1]|nr:hypothetical protein HMPREF0578_0398 [Mobiluncus mulieris 28-1]EFN92430.1 hypothetical protein HMPREF9278_1214 [Mobiluncus mulieris FB024-16]MCU9970741.1 hypothetical protein [Mobiluncus mulieris]MCU9976612.1 hypothetical protein [Mobiluncus mulieris]MCU9995647.1 hypothetical protein [Mobiluncus mulieris]